MSIFTIKVLVDLPFGEITNPESFLDRLFPDETVNLIWSVISNGVSNIDGVELEEINIYNDVTCTFGVPEAGEEWLLSFSTILGEIMSKFIQEFNLLKIYHIVSSIEERYTYRGHKVAQAESVIESLVERHLRVFPVLGR